MVGAGDVERRRPVSLATSSEKSSSWGRDGGKSPVACRVLINRPSQCALFRTKLKGISAEQVRGVVYSERLARINLY